MIISFYWASAHDMALVSEKKFEDGIPGRLRINLKLWVAKLRGTQHVPVLWVNNSQYQYMKQRSLISSYSKSKLQFMPNRQKTSQEFITRLCLDKDSYGTYVHQPLLIVNIEDYLFTRRFDKLLFLYKEFNNLGLYSLIKDFVMFLCVSHFGGFYLDLSMGPTHVPFPQTDAELCPGIRQYQEHIKEELRDDGAIILQLVKRSPAHPGCNMPDVGMYINFGPMDYRAPPFEVEKTAEQRRKEAADFEVQMKKLLKSAAIQHQTYVQKVTAANPAYQALQGSVSHSSLKYKLRELYRRHPMMVAELLKRRASGESKENLEELYNIHSLSADRAAFTRLCSEMGKGSGQIAPIMQLLLDNKHFKEVYTCLQEEIARIIEARLLKSFSGKLLSCSKQVSWATYSKLFFQQLDYLVTLVPLEVPSSTYYSGFNYLDDEAWAVKVLEKHWSVKKK
jgi:hypothetical protein